MSYVVVGALIVLGVILFVFCLKIACEVTKSDENVSQLEEVEEQQPNKSRRTMRNVQLRREQSKLCCDSTPIPNRPIPPWAIDYDSLRQKPLSSTQV